jgi:hypothetical protein
VILPIPDDSFSDDSVSAEQKASFTSGDLDLLCA